MNSFGFVGQPRPPPGRRPQPARRPPVASPRPSLPKNHQPISTGSPSKSSGFEPVVKGSRPVSSRPTSTENANSGEHMEKLVFFSSYDPKIGGIIFQYGFETDYYLMD